MLEDRQEIKKEAMQEGKQACMHEGQHKLHRQGTTGSTSRLRSEAGSTGSTRLHEAVLAAQAALAAHKQAGRQHMLEGRQERRRLCRKASKHACRKAGRQEGSKACMQEWGGRHAGRQEGRQEGSKQACRKEARSTVRAPYGTSNN